MIGEWISVKFALPACKGQSSDFVLIWTDYYSFDVAYIKRYKNGKCIWRNVYYTWHMNEILYWMPLPKEPPEEDASD